MRMPFAGSTTCLFVLGTVLVVSGPAIFARPQASRANETGSQDRKPVATPAPFLDGRPVAANYVAPGIEGLYAQLRADAAREEVAPGDAHLTPYTRYESPRTPPNPAAFNIHQVVLKFVEGSAVRLRRGALQPVKEVEAVETFDRLARAGLEPADVERELNAFNETARSLRVAVGRAAPQVEEQDLANLRRRAERNVGREMPDLNLFYFAHLPTADREVAQTFLDELRRLRSIEIAYFQPIPFNAGDIPPLTSIDVTPSQGYFRPAPTGIDVDFARSFLAGRGNTVRIADIESGWYLPHEDIAPPSFAFGVNWGDSHGTAVLGELAAEENGFGANGIVPNALIGWSSVTNLDPFQGIYFYSVGNALLMTGAALRAGDIALIEQQFQHYNVGFICNQATDPCRDCEIPPWVAVEEYAFEHAAISMVTAAGVIVVEAAGNGRMSVTPASPVDSGAIVVGASDRALTPMCWSNFGPRVNVHAWGIGVGTTGYGDDPSLQANGADSAQWYTNSFSGTSSASPIVVGAAAIIQSTRLAAGRPLLNSIDMRSLLVTTGTPQAAGSPTIGPLPNLRRAIASYLPDSARFVNQTTAPSPVAPGAVFTHLVTFVNSGGVAWSGAHTMSIAPSAQTGVPSFQATTFALGSGGTEVMPEQNVIRTFSITAPAQPGTYNLTTVLRNGFAQVMASSPTQQIVVAATNAPVDNANVTVISAPGSLIAGQSGSVTIEVVNTGTTTWSASGYSLGLQRGMRISLPQASLPVGTMAPSNVSLLTFVVICNGSGQGFFSAQMRSAAGSFGQQVARTVVCHAQ